MASLPVGCSTASSGGANAGGATMGGSVGSPSGGAPAGGNGDGGTPVDSRSGAADTGGADGGSGGTHEGSRGDGGTSASLGGAGESSGGPDEGGADTGGAAGGPSGSFGGSGSSCIPAGAENCFNNVDDDCDGLTDCSDPDCNAIAECVPDNSGFQLGTTIATAGTCPTHYGTATTSINQGFNAPGGCMGCSCNGAVDCRTSVHVQASCGSIQDTSYSLTSDCNATLNITTGNVHIDPISVVPQCKKSGTPSVPPATWAQSREFCQTAEVGGGCSVGNVCVAKLPAGDKHCTMQSGSQACGGNYSAEEGGNWYTGMNDQRSCGSNCICSSPVGGNCGTSFVSLAVSNTNCAIPTDIVNAGDRCSLDSPLNSGKIVLANTTAASCVDMTAQTVTTAAATGLQTLCCQ